MANYEQTTAAINSQIKTNGNREISGQILQNVLNTIVNNLKQGYLLVGIATPDGNPGTPDQNVCWLATKGTYVNYGHITVGNGKLAVIKYNGTWTSDTVDVQGAIKSGDGINVDPESGEVSVKVGDGLQIAGGKVAAKVGDGMQIADGSIAANVGDGLQIDGGKSAVNAGNGIKIADGKVAIDLIAGSYINIENGNKINCTLDANPFYVVDELPEAPPEGLNNKLWLVPVSGQPAVDLYKWNEETSQFDKVGTITLDVNTALFIKKGKNDITEPLELDSEDDIGMYGDMFILRNKAGRSIRLQLVLGTGSSSVIGDGAGLEYSKALLSDRKSLGLFCGLTNVYLREDGVLEMVVPNSNTPMPIRPTFYIVCPSGKSWDNPNQVLSISGIYDNLKQVLDLNADVALTFPSRQVVIGTDLQSFEDGQDIILTYRFSSRRFSLTIKSDDSIAITSAAYIWRFNATNYGISYWYNASGTNQRLYNDLRKLINGTSNVGGILGYLCDTNNVFAITNLNISGTTLKVSFLDGNTNRHLRLSINSSGQYNVIDYSYVKILYADDYNISSMPIPVEWPIASGTDVNLYNAIKRAYDTGTQVLLIEGSEANKGINEYAVSEIRNIGTGRYNVYFSLQGYKYCLDVRSNGTIATTSNLIQTEYTSLSITQNIAAATAQKIYQRLANAVAAFSSGDLYLADRKGKIFRVIGIDLPQGGSGAQQYDLLYISYYDQTSDPATVVLRSMSLKYANQAYSGKIVRADFTNGI